MKKTKMESNQAVTEPGSLNIEYHFLDDLVPYAKNPRTHSEEQIAQIAASMREFGFTNPILIDSNRRVIAGHGRLAAAKELGIEKVPCIDLSHLTEEQRRAYIIADNKIALNGGWNEELLRVELTALKDLGADLELTDFDSMELSTRVVMNENDRRRGVQQCGFPNFQIKRGKVGLSAQRIVPIRKKDSDIRSMIRRPYMSDSLAKRSVTNAAARDGIEINQAYKDIPFRSAAILGRAIVNVWMK